MLNDATCTCIALKIGHCTISIFTNLHFSLHFMVLLSDYLSLFSFSLWVACSPPFLYMHDAILLSSKRCSIVPASCGVRAYTNTPSHRPGCRTSAIDLWAFSFVLCAVLLLVWNSPSYYLSFPPLQHHISYISASLVWCVSSEMLHSCLMNLW